MAYFGPEKAEYKLGRADLRPLRAEFGPERAVFEVIGNLRIVMFQRKTVLNNLISGYC